MVWTVKFQKTYKWQNIFGLMEQVNHSDLKPKSYTNQLRLLKILNGGLMMDLLLNKLQLRTQKFI